MADRVLSDDGQRLLVEAFDDVEHAPEQEAQEPAREPEAEGSLHDGLPRTTASR